MAKKPAEAAPESRSMAFLSQRPLFSEDLSPAEDSRLSRARQEHTASIPARARTDRAAARKVATDTTKSPVDRKNALSAVAFNTSVLPHLTSVKETREQASSRIAQRLTHPNPATRLTAEPAVPGSSWYVDHNKDIHDAIKGTDIPASAAAVSSGSMSPLNSPDNEVRALRGIAHATASNAKTIVTPALADHVRDAVRQKPTKTKPGTDGTEFLPHDQVGRAVGFNELHPKVIAALTSTKTASKFPDLDTEIRRSDIRRAGTNKTSGVEGIRGASNSALSPPSSAPKVNTYSHNGLAFDSTDHAVKDDIDFRASDTVRRQRGVDLSAKMGKQGLSPAEHEELRGLPSHMDQPLDFNGTHSDKFEMTPATAKHVESMGGVVRPGSVGQTVSMRDQHPATAMALSHPSNPDQHTRRLAVLSSAHPTVQDSWANAEVHNQPNVTVGRATNVRKAGGSEKLGYWPTKTLKSGKDIVDAKRPGSAAVTPQGLQHADYDKITRMAASHVQKSLDLPYDYPSTIAQAGPWTEVRREAKGKDAEFEAKKSAAAPKLALPDDAGHADIHAHAVRMARNINTSQGHTQGGLF